MCCLCIYYIHIYIHEMLYTLRYLEKRKKEEKKMLSLYVMRIQVPVYFPPYLHLSRFSRAHRCCLQARSSSPCSSSSCISAHSSSTFFPHFVHNFFSFIFFFLVLNAPTSSFVLIVIDDIRTYIYMYKSTHTHTQRREGRKSTRVCVRSR